MCRGPLTVSRFRPADLHGGRSHGKATRYLSLVEQRLRLGTAIAELVTPATLSPIQAQVLERLKLMTPATYLQPTITPYPL
jgi:hypothetical protein